MHASQCRKCHRPRHGTGRWLCEVHERQLFGVTETRQRHGDETATDMRMEEVSHVA